METFSFILIQLLNALSQASLLFFLGSGLALIFGIMRVVNFSHGALYMLGAYIGYTVARLTGSVWLAMLIAPLLVGLLGLLFEMGFLRHLYKRDEDAFLLVTFGLTLVLAELTRLTWGAPPLQVLLPTGLTDVVFILDEPMPVYRLFLIAAGTISSLLIWQFLERTRLGLLIRATSQNAQMVHALGADINLIRSGVFALGCGLAALGGVLAAPSLTASLGMSSAVIDAFVIVIIGGMGSFLGAILGSLIVACVQTFGNFFFPDFALVFLYALMLGVLIIRPGGLLGKEV
ncbi:MAG: branched-chain amino acid ABC transporter permease [Alcaligenaceae bacterium]